MKPATMTVLALVGALQSGCFNNGLADEAERCTATTDCELPLECVLIDDNASVCLPRPPGRQERTCSVDSDCTLSDGQLWPLEAECLDGACRCLGAEVLCREEGFADEFSVILEEETCRCVPRGREGDSCITSHTCDTGLACVGGECRSAPEQPGSACLDDNDCGNGATCTEYRENNDVGVCR
jgi:hypothetical protein